MSPPRNELSASFWERPDRDSDSLALSLLLGTSGAILDLSAMFAGATIVVGGGTIKGFVIRAGGGNDRASGDTTGYCLRWVHGQSREPVHQHRTRMAGGADGCAYLTEDFLVR